MTKEESPIVFMRVSELEFELKMAREAEREACAKLAEKEAQYSVAEAVRERSANAGARGQV